MSALGWIAAVAGGWLCLAAVVGLAVGRVIRNRDRQIPTDNPLYLFRDQGKSDD